MWTPSDFTILVVDDNEEFLAAIVELLTSEGYSVLWATTGQAAIERCRQHEIHLLILDYRLPDLSGEEVVRQVRTFDLELQILLQTGHTETPPRQLLHALAIQGYHSKIDGPEKFLLWVDTILKNYTAIRARRNLENSLLVMSLAMEARDLETAGHTQRVVYLAERVGRIMGISGKELDALRQGAYLHDLGKLCVPDAVLLKPHRLSPDERTIMEAHAESGYELAMHIPGIPREALHVIRSHHERWDGSGYPDGLHGNEIPLLARIFAICDVYDAMVSTRPYKKTWSHQQTLAVLGDQSGKHFDPAVFEAFVQAFPHMLTVPPVLAKSALVHPRAA
ncbi:MAG: HD domain-containing protein [Caldilineaceae bacterium]|nr:HD domain-containing protein [Caldilineaceae bacterium]